jgi:hypothetical protein
MSNRAHLRYRKNPDDGKTYAQILKEDIKKHGNPQGISSWGEKKMNKALKN